MNTTNHMNQVSPVLRASCAPLHGLEVTPRGRTSDGHERLEDPAADVLEGILVVAGHICKRDDIEVSPDVAVVIVLLFASVKAWLTTDPESGPTAVTNKDEFRYCSSTNQVVLILLLTVRSLSCAIQSATPSPVTSNP
ncbi:MAG: hypothetical protein ACREJN_14880 [Nitrospiraceae bacterium]